MSLLSSITGASCPRVATVLLVSMLSVISDAVLRSRDYRALPDSRSFTDIMKFLGAFTLVFLQLFALFYFIALLPGPLRAIALLFSVFLVIVQLSYWQTLSQFMTGTDLYLSVTVSGAHRIEAILSFFKPQVLVYALPYLLILSLLLFVPPVSDAGMTIALSILLLLYLFVSNYVLFRFVPERSFHLNPLTSFLRAIAQCAFESRQRYQGIRDSLPAFQVSQRPLDSVIYVIDESVRGSNLSLNGYPRATTPFLQSLETEGRLINLGICVAASSFTHISNAYLLSGHNEFPDTDFRTRKNPTIFDYAKTMGYETIYIDINRVYLASLKKAAGDGPVRSLDSWMNENSFEEQQIDLEVTKDSGVARVLSAILNKGGGYFIVVNKKGLHFQYCNNYPDDTASTIWTPVMKTLESIDPGPTGREKLVNSYDNGIRYQVDEFFRVFVSETTNQNYVILYTSDHGQTLAEHGQRYTHMKADPEIVDVPDFLVSSEQYARQGLLDDIEPGIRVSHLNNFATLLDLMEVPLALRVRSYEKSIFALTTGDNSDRCYMSGSLHGSGDYTLHSIPTPPGDGWGHSLPVGAVPGSSNEH